MLSKVSFRQSLNFCRNSLQFVNGYANISQGENPVAATPEKSKVLPKGFNGPEGKDKKNEKTGRPKTPLNWYARFVKDFNHGKTPLRNLNEAHVKGILREASQAWSKLPEAEKQKYKDMANEDLKKFQEKLEIWKTKVSQKVGAEAKS
ncbi:HMG-box domain-containing protein [Ditylenchus destructor]|nr:HMG-box domain-containing protein [Ditylenchus destructor]